MKTQLTIHYIGEQTNAERARERSLVGLLFALTTVFGVLVGVLFSERVPFPGSVREQLATPVLTLPAAARGVAALEERTLPEIAGAQTEGTLAAIAESEAARDKVRAETAAQVATVNATINAQELLIMQITREMELIKDSSVALIAEFETNCGNWKDTCGTSYAADLEAENVRYAGLVERLHEAERVRSEAETERSRLMASAE
jgi:hypothetical protein